MAERSGFELSTQVPSTPLRPDVSVAYVGFILEVSAPEKRIGFGHRIK
jgi:hypothetical protein